MQWREGALATRSLRPEQPQGSPSGRVVQTLPAKAGDAVDAGSIPESERYPGVGNDNPLQYSCLENSKERRSLAGYSPWGCKESEKTEHARTSQTPRWSQVYESFIHTSPKLKQPRCHLIVSSLKNL